MCRPSGSLLRSETGAGADCEGEGEEPQCVLHSFLFTSNSTSHCPGEFCLLSPGRWPLSAVCSSFPSSRKEACELHHCLFLNLISTTAVINPIHPGHKFSWHVYSPQRLQQLPAGPVLSQSLAAFLLSVTVFYRRDHPETLLLLFHSGAEPRLARC